jgi:hypothetical protein
VPGSLLSNLIHNCIDLLQFVIEEVIAAYKIILAKMHKKIVLANVALIL